MPAFSLRRNRAFPSERQRIALHSHRMRSDWEKLVAHLYRGTSSDLKGNGERQPAGMRARSARKLTATSRCDHGSRTRSHARRTAVHSLRSRSPRTARSRRASSHRECRGNPGYCVRRPLSLLAVFAAFADGPVTGSRRPGRRRARRPLSSCRPSDARNNDGRRTPEQA